ncbi:MAG: type II toxin-antitoxin system VapC family toxin [Actinobacteria bacterium]|nr:type II toxin-antitoxin system VapC family toxin [Actinomycetota bacterium]
MSAEQGTRARGILDTSTVVLLGRLPDTRDLPVEPLITAITLAELAVGPLVARRNDERARRQEHLQQAEADFVALPFDADAARAFGSVAASMRNTGRKSGSRRFDALIAAIAVANDLPVHTCNPGDFEGIDRLEVVAVEVPPE